MAKSISSLELRRTTNENYWNLFWANFSHQEFLLIDVFRRKSYKRLVFQVSAVFTQILCEDVCLANVLCESFFCFSSDLFESTSNRNHMFWFFDKHSLFLDVVFFWKIQNIAKLSWIFWRGSLNRVNDKPWNACHGTWWAMESFSWSRHDHGNAAMMFLQHGKLTIVSIAGLSFACFTIIWLNRGIILVCQTFFKLTIVQRHIRQDNTTAWLTT